MCERSLNVSLGDFSPAPKLSMPLDVIEYYVDHHETAVQSKLNAISELQQGSFDSLIHENSIEPEIDERVQIPA